MRKTSFAVFLLLVAWTPLGSCFDAGLHGDEIISADELRQKQLHNESLVLFDARGSQSYRDDHIEGAVLPMTQDYYDREELFRKGALPEEGSNQDDALGEATQKYPKETPIVAYCNANCGASAALLSRLKKLGFKNVRAMTEGIQEWERKGYPVVKKPAAAMTAENPLIPKTQAPCGQDTPCHD